MPGFRAFLFCHIAVLFTLRNGEREMIGEWLNENTITGIASHRVSKDRFRLQMQCPETAFPVLPVPLRDQVQSQQHQYANKRETRILIALTIICSPKRTMVIIPRSGSATESHAAVVSYPAGGHEAFNCIGDCHAINQQNRVIAKK